MDTSLFVFKVWRIALAIFLAVVGIGMFTVIPFFVWIISISGVVAAVSVVFDR